MIPRDKMKKKKRMVSKMTRRGLATQFKFAVAPTFPESRLGMLAVAPYQKTTASMPSLDSGRCSCACPELTVKDETQHRT